MSSILGYEAKPPSRRLSAKTAARPTLKDRKLNFLLNDQKSKSVSILDGELWSFKVSLILLKNCSPQAL